MMNKTALILEGGGMRALYTCGVLDFFMSKNLEIPYVIGVSAGASNGSSYISGQYQRNKHVNIDYIKDSRFLSIKNLFKEKSLFGQDFLFNQLPNKLAPFDYNSFFESKMNFIITATDCISGKPVYFDKKSLNNSALMEALKASTSIPFVSPMISFRGMQLLDGGISDSIPVQKSIDDGNKKHIIVLTRNKGYRKKPSGFKFFTSFFYKNYPELAKLLTERSNMYNKTLDLIDKLENKGKIFIIQPENKIEVGRMEKNPKKLETLYNQGLNEASRCYNRLMDWIKE